MATRGAFSIIKNESGKILLIRRKDFPIWDLPGGKLENNETIEICAIREAEEETGYIIQLEKQIGEYHRPTRQDIQYVFTGKIIGGKPIHRGSETSKLKFCHVKFLPLLMVPHRKEQIKDYVSGKHNIKMVLTEKKSLLNILRRLKYKH